jgi:hypothetical protein
MTNDSGITATSARSAVPEPSGPAAVESLDGDRPAAGRPRLHPAVVEAGAEADPGGAGPGEAGPGGAGPIGAGPSAAGMAVLATLAVAWLAAMLWVAHATISSDVGAVALATAASTLPSVVSAALVAGAGAALVALGTLISRERPGGLPERRPRGLAARAGGRFTVAVSAGLLTGVLAGAAFVAGSGSDPARMALAGTLAAGATIGGALAGARNLRVVAAVVAAGLAVFAAGFFLGLVKGQIQDFYGAGDDEASQLSAAGWFAATAAVVSGLAAGLTAYRVLGGARRNPVLRWPAYLVAGAGPGALLLVTELVTRTGGAKLLGLVREISDADRTFQAWAEGSRVNNALVVLFVGAVIAIVGLGRTLAPGAAAGEPDDSPGTVGGPADGEQAAGDRRDGVSPG